MPKTGETASLTRCAARARRAGTPWKAEGLSRRGAWRRQDLCHAVGCAAPQSGGARCGGGSRRDPWPGRDRSASRRSRGAATPACQLTRTARSWSSTSTRALARRPELIVVDELAHSNAPDSRHPKRFQDVEELLNAGIDVWTALNIQHVESLSDVVAGITGVTVREVVPDTVIEKADDVVVVDITPDELIQRLKDGKVYLPENARRAADNFLKPGNLTALRELALRRTADRVDDADGELSAPERHRGAMADGGAHPRLRRPRSPFARRGARCRPPCQRPQCRLGRGPSRPDRARLARCGLGQDGSMRR